MNGNLAIIRKRYQLTIPYSLRKFLDWITPQKAIKISIISKEKILIEPYKEKVINWDKIWHTFEQVKKSGKKGSLTEFLVRDRESH